MTEYQPDLRFLEKIAKGDRQLLQEVCHIFLTEVPKEIDALIRSYQQGDAIKGAAIAHKIKSSFHFFAIQDSPAHILERLFKNPERHAEIPKNIENLKYLTSQIGKLMNQ